MKTLLFSFTLILLSACDLRPPKGSDQDWQQRQERMEEDKTEDIQQLDREMEKEEDRREVNSEPIYKDINFTPANN